jgi:DNA-binding MarR family transcriptional regulator
MGLEPRQHQLMLALKGLPAGMRPTIGTLAERLQIQHHSTVELVNRLSTGGLVRRVRAGEDRRQVLLALTPKGEKLLQELSIGHKAELRTRGPSLVAALEHAIRPKRGAQPRAPKIPSERSGEAG